ncbi:16S rRNA (cytosine(1402)-N(4))-methyltransferase RsmH [Halorhodospira neutriphila]|uniref:16S rRNA (cytosine(1402)-N(4))-methyltransferase RsmH n=1 Tax=Halorhodospira neutriphila TaxID=168379 RepID=UPI003B839BDC
MNGAAEDPTTEREPLPAGEHYPVLRDAVLEGLAIAPEGRYVDATYGRGGHAHAVLERLAGGALIAADRDPEALEYAREHLGGDPRCRVLRARLAELPERLRQWGLAGEIDGLLVDLGVSSPQLEAPGRGFSFRHDGPLDMRMDPEAGEPAAQLLQRLSVRELAGLLRRYGEERQAGRIAKAIVAEREAGRPLQRTRALAELVDRVVGGRAPGRHHPATKTFQALRIAVNDELGELDRLLEGVIDLLRPGGRLAAISFHSLEDRRVKRFIRDASSVGDLPPGVPIPPEGRRPRLRPIGGAQRAGAAERDANPRARSAVLRVAERLP